MTRRLSLSFCGQMWRPSQSFVLGGFVTLVLNLGMVLVMCCVSAHFLRAIDVWGSQEALARERNLRKEMEKEYQESRFIFSLFKCLCEDRDLVISSEI